MSAPNNTCDALRIVDVPDLPGGGALLVPCAGLVLVDSGMSEDQRQDKMDWARDEMARRARRQESIADQAAAAGAKTPYPPDDAPVPDWATYTENSWYHEILDSEDPRDAWRPWARATYREFPGVASVGLMQLWDGRHFAYGAPYVELERVDRNHLTLSDVGAIGHAWPEVMATMRAAQELHESAPGRESEAWS